MCVVFLSPLPSRSLKASADGLLSPPAVLRVRGDKAGESIEFNSRSGERHREALLVSLCTRSFATGRTIIFFRSKAQAHRMKILFTLYGQGLERSDELHGDLTQEQRLASLKKFREGEIGFLLATDLASRGCVGLFSSSFSLLPFARENGS